MLSLVSTIINPEHLIYNTYTLSTNLISSIKYLYNMTHKDTELEEFIKSNDLILFINIIHSFIEEENIDKNNKTINLCITNINQTLYLLEQNLTILTNKIKDHELLWFKQIRTFNIQKEKDEIIKLFQILKIRFDLLIKINKN